MIVYRTVRKIPPTNVVLKLEEKKIMFVELSDFHGHQKEPLATVSSIRYFGYISASLLRETKACVSVCPPWLIPAAGLILHTRKWKLAVETGPHSGRT
jgi:hypothetical protein